MNFPVRPPSPSRPRQRRAAATRQRLYEAAMAEYTRVGLDAARVEDIVAAAGVSWGTFFHYFPAKEDVLLDAAAELARAYSATAQAGMAAGHGTEATLSAAFTAQFQAAAQVTSSDALRGKILMYVVTHPGSLTQLLSDSDDRLLPPMPATTAVLAQGQLRGEIRADEPAESLAVIVLYAVLFSTQRAATIGRPPGSAPLGGLALQTVLRGMASAPDTRYSSTVDVIAGRPAPR
jgi:AcrR family transcriptional regulator